MYNFVICVPIYSKAKPFLHAFLHALTIATKNFKVKVLFVLDNVDLEHEKQLINNLNKSLFEIIKIKKFKTISEIRNILLKNAIKINSDTILFTDCDDLLEKKALLYHSSTLNNYDFSFSDQILINNEGELLKKNLFDNWKVPKKINTIDKMLDGNFIGFSASAIRSNCLVSKDILIPKDVLASDWWLFSKLILEGFSGGITSDPVVKYRQHSENLLLFSKNKFNYEKILSLINLIIVHFFHLPRLPIKRYLAC